MRLDEFTDPTDYTITDTEVPNLLEQIESLWPPGIGDDVSSYLLRPSQRPQSDRASLLDER